MEKKSKRVMSGMRSTGPMHIGHYFGALKNWLDLQEKHTCFFGAMDWHAQTSLYKSTKTVDPFIKDNIAEWIAWGLDFEKNYIYVQSGVPETLELYMIFANLTPMGWLERVTTWKGAIQEMKQKDIYNLGRFGYPVLQTADISIMEGELVPVGQDQVAHLEISREIVRRFNRLYKAQLPEPKALLTKTPLVVGQDGRKMSSSYENFIGLSDEPKKIKQSVNKMVTDPQRATREDPGEPTVCSVYALHKLFSSSEDLKWVESGCRSAGIGCGDCKLKLSNNINNLCEIPREKKKELLNHPQRLDSIIAEGCYKARKVAQETLKKVKETMGLRGGMS